MKNTYVLCRDVQTVLDFLYRVDKTLPVPLSARVNMEAFACSAVEGFVYGICREGQLESAALVVYGYLDKPFAYLNLLATVPGCEGRGYAGILLRAAEEAAIKDGMVEFHLHANAENERAVSFYKRRGYRILETQPKLHMAKVL